MRTQFMMERSLSLTVNSSILGVFEVEGVPSGYFNFTISPKLVVYIPTGTVLSLLLVEAFSVISVHSHCIPLSIQKRLAPINVL